MSSLSPSPRTPRHPPSVRLKLWLGRNLGWLFGLGTQFVAEDHVQVVYHESRYAGVRGPGVIVYSRWNEMLGPLVFTGNQIKDAVFGGLISRDVVPVSVRVRAILRFDPRDSRPEIARVLTTQGREVITRIGETYLQHSLLRVVNQYNATEVTLNDVTRQIEEHLFQTLPEQMQPLGLHLAARPQILGVELPHTLAERHELLAQRQALIAASGGRETDPRAIRQALITEIVERIDKKSAGEAFINFSQILDSLVAPAEGNPLPNAPIINQPVTGPRSDTQPPASGSESRL